MVMLSVLYQASLRYGGRRLSLGCGNARVPAVQKWWGRVYSGRWAPCMKDFYKG